MIGPPNDGSRDRGIEPGGSDPVVGEARWHMAGAVLAAMLLTLLLPSELRLGPRLLLPILEAVFLERTVDEWLGLLIPAGVPSARINSAASERRLRPCPTSRAGITVRCAA